ncbi:KLHL7 [Cordylochernes scorpioides]|uniref:KLHL7 n=1 Tax=Cordylochernes scorpioides TaxID=51811 RepID=A0ABY6KRH2_9ARAC|nr:KLHL7 [Cordylochernes scorpioides]
MSQRALTTTYSGVDSTTEMSASMRMNRSPRWNITSEFESRDTVSGSFVTPPALPLTLSRPRPPSTSSGTSYTVSENESTSSTSDSRGLVTTDTVPAAVTEKTKAKYDSPRRIAYTSSGSNNTSSEGCSKGGHKEYSLIEDYDEELCYRNLLQRPPEELPPILAQGMVSSLQMIPEEVQKDDPTNRHHAKLGLHAFNLWVQSNMTDITVRVGRHSFQAHKAVLTCYCPFLKKNLLYPGLTKIQGVELHNITERAFEVLLTYMYTGKLKLTPNNIGEVYRASRLLQMKEITCVCTDILSGRIGGILSILYLYVTSKDLGIRTAWAKAYKVLGTHFDQVVETFEFLELHVDNVTEILNVNPIGASSEIAVFLAAIRWLDYRYMDRESFILEIMSCVRFPMMTIQEILACYHPPILPGNIEVPEIQLMLLKATWTYLYDVPTLLWDLSMYDPFFYTDCDLEKAAITIQKHYRGHLARYLLSRLRSTQNKAAPIIQSYFRGFLARKKYNGFLQKYKEGAYEGYLPNGLLHDPFLHDLLHFPRRGVIVNDSFIRIQKYFREEGLKFKNQECIILLGGINPANMDNLAVCSSIFRYDIRENYWQKVAKLPVPRHQHKAVYYNNYIYIIGGCDPRETINGELVPNRSCFSFNVLRAQWTRMNDMYYSRMYHGVCQHEGIIYVIGGKDEYGRLLASVEIYHIKEERWEELSPMCTPKMGMGVAAHHAFIWVVGGIVRTIEDAKTFVVSDVEIYDIHCKICDDYIYMLGGVYRNNVVKAQQLDSMNDVLHYEDNQWKPFVSLNTPCHDITVVAIAVTEKTKAKYDSPRRIAYTSSGSNNTSSEGCSKGGHKEYSLIEDYDEELCYRGMVSSLQMIPEEVQKDDPTNRHHAKLGLHAFNLWVQSNMTDITVRVGRHSFQAHKAVLTCYCPFLKKNLLYPGLTKIQGVELHNITERAFEVLLTYMYTGKLKLTPNNIGEVYRASRLLQMKEITCVCTDILSGRIGGILSILYLYVTSKDLGIRTAWAKAYKVLGTHFDQVVETFEFLELHVDNVTEILNVNPIGASSEIAVFLAAIRWLDYRYMDRESFILEIMSCVRFPMMTIQEILACYHPPILPGNIEVPEIQLMLLKATW